MGLSLYLTHAGGKITITFSKLVHQSKWTISTTQALILLRRVHRSSKTKNLSRIREISIF